MKDELYGEVRALTVAHQSSIPTPWSMSRSQVCTHCHSRWEKIKAVLDRIVDNAEAIREDNAADAREAARIKDIIENLPTVKLRPRRPRGDAH